MADNKQGPKIMEKRLTMLEEYLYANLAFWVFLVIAAVFSFFICGGVWDDVWGGTLEFLFVIVGGGFSLVSVLDYFYEKRASSPASEGKKT